MKVRIGNDIRLKVQLNIGNNKFASILSAEAYFINTTLKNKLESEYKKKNRFIGRFPIEPFVDEFEPSAYNINSTGYPKYRAYVVNQYNGFGLHPDWKNVMPVKDVNITEYRSNIEYTTDSKSIIVTFPSNAQLYTGQYQLVIKARVYDAGYSNNSRVITTNWNDVFELVEDNADADSKTMIEIVNTSDVENQDVYVVSGTYNNDSIRLDRNDGGYININVSPISGWHEGD